MLLELAAADHRKLSRYIVHLPETHVLEEHPEGEKKR
jgi:hypothetical protein